MGKEESEESMGKEESHNIVMRHSYAVRIFLSGPQVFCFMKLSLYVHNEL